MKKFVWYTRKIDEKINWWNDELFNLFLPETVAVVPWKTATPGTSSWIFCTKNINTYTILFEGGSLLNCLLFASIECRSEMRNLGQCCRPEQRGKTRVKLGNYRMIHAVWYIFNFLCASALLFCRYTSGNGFIHWRFKLYQVISETSEFSSSPAEKT